MVDENQTMPEMHKTPKGNMLPWIVLAIVVVVIAIGAIVFRDKLFNSSEGGAKAEKPSGYQAVFLTNGQVYFGKLSSPSGSYVGLKDIYYLQVTNPPLQGSGAAGQAQQSQQQPQLSLVKLGSELHGPVDAMEINRDQILFYEDIKEDGKVMQAIREYQKNPPAPNAQQTQSTQQAPSTQAPATQTPTK